MADNVSVVCRVRPLLPHEPCTVVDTVTFPAKRQVVVGRRRVFTFDGVAVPTDTTERLFATHVAPLVELFTRGFNATVLAYGQTGSGKTHTASGLAPLVLRALVSDTAVAARSEDTCSAAARPSSDGEPRPVSGRRSGSAASAALPLSELSFSFIEAYGETLCDLLDPSHGRPLQLFECVPTGGVSPAPTPASASAAALQGGATPNAASGSAAGGGSAEHAAAATTASSAPPSAAKSVALGGGANTGTFVAGATRATAATIDEALWLLSHGLATRSTAATNMNATSSRSHAIFTIHSMRHNSKFHIVDLAGSERNKRTLNVGVRFQESIHINSGLLALGNVIRALASRRSHVPYRESKLTRLLADSLGGNSRTVFIACVAPNKANADETLRTLQYGCRAMQILNEAVPNIDVIAAEQRRQLAAAAAAAEVAEAAAAFAAAEAGNTTAANAARRASHGGADLSSDAALVADDAFVAAQAAEIRRLAARADSLEASLAATRAELSEARTDLKKDEVVFAAQLSEIARLSDANAVAMARIAELERAAQRMAATASAAVPSGVAGARATAAGSGGGDGGSGGGNNARPPRPASFAGAAADFLSPSPARLTLHDQTTTLARRYEGACDFVLPFTGDEVSSVAQGLSRSRHSGSGGPDSRGSYSAAAQMQPPHSHDRRFNGGGGSAERPHYEHQQSTWPQQHQHQHHAGSGPRHSHRFRGTPTETAQLPQPLPGPFVPYAPHHNHHHHHHHSPSPQREESGVAAAGARRAVSPSKRLLFDDTVSSPESAASGQTDVLVVGRSGDNGGGYGRAAAVCGTPDERSGVWAEGTRVARTAAFTDSDGPGVALGSPPAPLLSARQPPRGGSAQPAAVAAAISAAVASRVVAREEAERAAAAERRSGALLESELRLAAAEQDRRRLCEENAALRSELNSIGDLLANPVAAR